MAPVHNPLKIKAWNNHALLSSQLAVALTFELLIIHSCKSGRDRQGYPKCEISFQKHCDKMLFCGKVFVSLQGENITTILSLIARLFLLKVNDYWMTHWEFVMEEIFNKIVVVMELYQSKRGNKAKV